MVHGFGVEDRECLQGLAAEQQDALAIIVEAFPVSGFADAFEQQAVSTFVDDDQIDAIFIEQIDPVGAARSDSQIIAPDFFGNQMNVEVHHGFE